MKNKLLNRFIGVIEDRDEYQQGEIHKELAFSGMLLWILTMLLMSICLVIDTIHDRLSFETLSLLIINMIYAIYIVVRLRKKHLYDTDCASLAEYEEKKRWLKKSSILAGVLWGFFMLIFMQYLLPYSSTSEIDVSWPKILIWIVVAALFGTILYWFSKSKLKRHF